MRSKLKALAAAGAAVAALGGVAAAPASADLRYSNQYCVAILTNDGHRLYNITCGTGAPGARFAAQMYVCNTSSCRWVLSDTWVQGTNHTFTTGGFIANVRMYTF